MMNAFEQTMGDTEWLIDEVVRLKEMIREVPYLERPMGQDSILDILTRIAFAADELFLPLMKDSAEAAIVVPQWDLQSIDAHFGRAKATVDDPDLLLEKLLSSKKRIYQVMQGMDPDQMGKKFTFSDGEVSVRELVERMNTFDRKQLKFIAERMLSMDTERPSNK